MTKTRRHRSTSLWMALILSLLTAPLAANTYIVTLKSGATFESRYKPKQASWDAGKVLVYSDVGNWLSLSRADIESVKNSLENKGFGHSLNTTTVELGWAPNDAMSPEDLANAMRQNPAAFFNQPAQTPYSVNQFVEPGATQGIPLYGNTNPLNTNFPLAGSGVPGLGISGYLPGYPAGSATPRSSEPVTPP